MDRGKLAIGLIVAGTVCTLAATRTSNYGGPTEYQLHSFKPPVKEWPIPKREIPPDYAIIRRSPSQELIEQMDAERPKDIDKNKVTLRESIL